ncbi:MAG: exonuclease domain-containing protein [Pseudomonadales bacterium]|jgi:DNA polymerase III alpha subunit (gram-positive type)|nr:exonuclease domain-containing protein [Pseudomonadales bacterium]
MRLICVLCLVLPWVALADTEPDFVRDMAKVPFSLSNPQTEPEQWLLAHVDVETTGLTPGYHEMIDVGVIITDLAGIELDRLFMRIMPAHPERAESGAVAVNGFSISLWRHRGYVSEAQAIDQWFAFHERVVGSREVLFVAYNAWFDISFVDQLFRKRGRTWRHLFHYFILDLPSMAWSQGVHGLTGQHLAQKLGIAVETRDPLEHTGITGAEFNVRAYQALISLAGTQPAK